MSVINSNRTESMVDLVIRAYGHLEGIIQFSKDNGVALDAVETTTVERVVDDGRKAELINEVSIMPVISPPVKTTFKSNRAESVVDLAILAYGHIEGMIDFARDNSMALDAVESSAVTRLVDQQRKQELLNERIMMPVRFTPTRTEMLVSRGQNNIDLALQEFGSVEGLIGFLRENGIGANDTIVAGNMIKVPTSNIINDQVRQFYKAHSYLVNTGEGVGTFNDGIDYMIIEDTFIVQ